jgi:hypothetical protein
MSGITDLVQLIRERDQVVREQSQRLEHYAGQIGFYQARVQTLEAEVKLLSAPTPEPAPEPAPAQQANEPMTVDTTPPVLSSDSPLQRVSGDSKRPWWTWMWKWVKA